jgi:hypothetical protein
VLALPASDSQWQNKHRRVLASTFARGLSSLQLLIGQQGRKFRRVDRNHGSMAVTRNSGQPVYNGEYAAHSLLLSVQVLEAIP